MRPLAMEFKRLSQLNEYCHYEFLMDMCFAVWHRIARVNEIGNYRTRTGRKRPNGGPFAVLVSVTYRQAKAANYFAVKK